MSRRDDFLLIGDILESIEAIYEFVKDTSYDEFLDSKMKLFAVVRAFEIIGEAAKLVSEKTKLHYPLVEWKVMTDFRNKLIHEYFGINYEIVWDIIHNDLKYNYEMIKHIKRI